MAGFAQKAGRVLIWVLCLLFLCVGLSSFEIGHRLGQFFAWNRWTAFNLTAWAHGYRETHVRITGFEAAAIEAVIVRNRKINADCSVAIANHCELLGRERAKYFPFVLRQICIKRIQRRYSEGRDIFADRPSGSDLLVIGDRSHGNIHRGMNVSSIGVSDVSEGYAEVLKIRLGRGKGWFETQNGSGTGGQLLPHQINLRLSGIGSGLSGISGFLQLRRLALHFRELALHRGKLTTHGLPLSSGIPDVSSGRKEDHNGGNRSDPIRSSHELKSPRLLGCFVGMAALILAFLGYFAILYSLSRHYWFLFGRLGLFFLGVALFAVSAYLVHRALDLLENDNTVTQKYLLTSLNYCNTVMSIGRTQMANVLPMEKQVAVISALAEGTGIRQTERITGVNRETVMNLGVRVGKGCIALLDQKMRGLSCRNLQFDELWGFIGKKERHLRPNDDPTLGDVWTFCAIDSDTKIVPSFKVGKRDSATANAFVADVASRMAGRVQISADALGAYVNAIESVYGSEVDFAQIIKTYWTDDSIIAERKFSAPEVVTTEKRRIAGFPDMRKASTSHIERLNGTTRLHMRRLTRLTYAFSKKRENFETAVGLHFAYYNFVKRHNTLRVTPAMEAGIERDFWTVSDLVKAAA